VLVTVIPSFLGWEEPVAHSPASLPMVDSPVAHSPASPPMVGHDAHIRLPHGGTGAGRWVASLHTTRVGRVYIQYFLPYTTPAPWVHPTPCYCSGRHHCTDGWDGERLPGSEREIPMGGRLSPRSGPQECLSSYGIPA